MNKQDKQAFIDAYMECALWSSTDDGGKHLDSYQLSHSAKFQMYRDCLNWLSYSHSLIESEPGHCFSRAGHHFWLTRNSHGAGFWDGYWPINGEDLTQLCKRAGECDLYLGDDNLVYIL